MCCVVAGWRRRKRPLSGAAGVKRGAAAAAAWGAWGRGAAGPAEGAGGAEGATGPPKDPRPSSSSVWTTQLGDTHVLLLSGHIL